MLDYILIVSFVYLPPLEEDDSDFMLGTGSSQGQAIFRKCSFCDKYVYVKGNKRKAQKRVFCSVKCYQKYRKEHPKEYGGEKHWNWKGGISEKNHLLRNTPKYKEWHDAVFRRDNWTCQKCGYKGKIINAHHIKSWSDFPELRYDVNNGITLCDKCHKKEHSEIGIRNRFKKGLKPKNKIKIPPKDELEQLYVVEKMGSPTIGQIYDVSHKTVLKWLRSYNVIIRTR